MTQQPPQPPTPPVDPAPYSPRPTLMNFQVQVVQTPAGQLVTLTITSHSGQHIAFMTGTEAQQLGGQIRAAGKQAASGLLLPGVGFLSPPADNGDEP